MPWFKVDDQSTFNPKVVRAGNGAFGALIRLGAYCNAQLTNGFVTDEIVRMVASSRELEKMLDANMLHPVDGGYQIHDYLEYQASKEQVQADRQAIKERVKRHRNGVTAPVTTAVTNAYQQRDRNAVGNTVGNSPLSSPIQSYPILSEETQTPIAASPLVLVPTVRAARFDLGAIYAEYPRKVGKAKGVKALERQIKTAEDFDRAMQGVIAFAVAMKSEGRPVDKIPYFSTWVNEEQWRDYAELPAGQSPTERQYKNFQGPRPAVAESKEVKL
jgi:hypothetical protein